VATVTTTQGLTGASPTQLPDLGATAGDPGAWEALVDRHAQYGWDTARDFGLATSVAASVFVLAFLRLADHFDQLWTDAEVRSWLCATIESEACKVCYEAWLSGKPARPRLNGARRWGDA
jgi:hypothetical protein